LKLTIEPHRAKWEGFPVIPVPFGGPRRELEDDPRRGHRTGLNPVTTVIQLLIRRPGVRTRVGECPLFSFRDPLNHLRGNRMQRDAPLVERVRGLAVRVASTYGLEIFDVQFRREASGMVLRVRLRGLARRATLDPPCSRRLE